MEPEDPVKEKSVKIAGLEKELTDLRQGLCLVQDYYHDLEKVAKAQDAEERVDQSLLKPLLAEDAEFEGIWKFHEEMLIPDPASSITDTRMYESFVSYCRQKGRGVADQPSFEFVLAQMGIQKAGGGGAWQGYRIRGERV
ncbi:MAG: hypothetical protein A4E35_01615 [Methanoregula sp. PtaU1.Bin051]|nr:MAG: hypothetical protein A4E35_01615 [Methanoregula sp. PtaU1.Bin051]